ncbi:MAG TPA: alpha-glucan family phosphorylase [Dehalococcoidia bacterium]|nr:alpha-glucan family phosphorylase [Dehalococcoidia bacterium]
MTADRRVAYFSMEIGLEDEMPTYSGGLGVLAGDTLRAAADLGAPIVAVSLLYRQGYFHQHLSPDGAQTESIAEWEPARFLEQTDVVVRVQLEGRFVAIGAWLYRVRGINGDEVPVYMLDTDLPENDYHDRRLTDRLYGGDQRYRLRQEALLGLGGLALLRALGCWDIETFHLNEGHSGLLTLGLLGEVTGGDLEAATEADFAAVRSKVVFTTHTPVPAGHDRFPFSLVREVLGRAFANAIERLPCWDGNVLNMTQLSMFFARYINGVAQMHGRVIKDMYPGYETHSITNGVHSRMWASEPLAALFDSEVPGWRADSDFLRRILTVDVDKILGAHAEAKARLLDAVEQRRGVRLDPHVFTIGFARRAATYKRADLVFSDVEALLDVTRRAGPLQFIYAGKAHPDDAGAKALIQRVFSMSERLGDELPVVYLEDHNMALGRLLCSGVDLWLNNPEKPMEASGTSGMKAALNGVPSLSVLDGWWPEGWMEGVTGWSIGDGSDFEGGSSEEAVSLYSKLRSLILPMYYESRQSWGRVMRAAIAINGPYFSTQRMLHQYMSNAYRLPQRTGH